MSIVKKKYVLEKAIAEARNFIEAAEDAIQRIKEEEINQYYPYKLKEVATAKRKSMDLSNTLVLVRKPS